MGGRHGAPRPASGTGHPARWLLVGVGVVVLVVVAVVAWRGLSGAGGPTDVQGSGTAPTPVSDAATVVTGGPSTTPPPSTSARPASSPGAATAGSPSGSRTRATSAGATSTSTVGSGAATSTTAAPSTPGGGATASTSTSRTAGATPRSSASPTAVRLRRVAVYNATPRTGYAARTASRLGGAGWVVVDVGNWRSRPSSTTVYYPDGAEAAGRALADELGVSRLRPATSGMPEGVLVVVLAS